MEQEPKTLNEMLKKVVDLYGDSSAFKTKKAKRLHLLESPPWISHSLVGARCSQYERQGSCLVALVHSFFN